MTAQDSAIRSKAKSSAPETELIDIGEQARLSARRRERIMSFASPLGLLLIWEIAGRLGFDRRALLPGAVEHHRRHGRNDHER